MSTGPVQLLVVGFEEPTFGGQIKSELQRLTASGAVRVVDAIAVQKADNGAVSVMRGTDLSPDQMKDAGAIIGGLIGLGAAAGNNIDPSIGASTGADLGTKAAESGHLFSGARVPDIVEEMEPGTAAAVVLLEHMWAAPLRDAVTDAGGFAVVDTFIQPEDLVTAGFVAAQL